LTKIITSLKTIFKTLRLAQTILDRNVRVCVTVRANRGIPHDLEGEDKHLNKGQSAFQRRVT